MLCFMPNSFKKDMKIFNTVKMKKRIAIVITLTFLMTGVFAQEKVEYKTEIAIPYYSKDIMKGNKYMQEMCVFDFYYPPTLKISLRLYGFMEVA